MKNFVVGFPCKGTWRESSPLGRLHYFVTCSCGILKYISYIFIFGLFFNCS